MRITYCWWLKSGIHQLRLVVYPIIYRVSAPSQVVGNGISAINSRSTKRSPKGECGRGDFYKNDANETNDSRDVSGVGGMCAEHLDSSLFWNQSDLVSIVFLYLYLQNLLAMRPSPLQQFCFFTFPPHPLLSIIELVMSSILPILPIHLLMFLFSSPGDIGHHFILAGDLLKFSDFIPRSNTSLESVLRYKHPVNTHEQNDLKM